MGSYNEKIEKRVNEIIMDDELVDLRLEGQKLIGKIVVDGKIQESVLLVSDESGGIIYPDFLLLKIVERWKLKKAEDCIASRINFIPIETGIAMIYNYTDTNENILTAGGIIPYDSIDYEREMKYAFEALVRFEKKRND
ncbi:MAG: hypothetical protein DRP09_10565 [Candidatus Thorarchaeota archaeon]|nr:MAG: hypothetical protein DRP09_10565 [Candidatus Thorarchaeota archaeon]